MIWGGVLSLHNCGLNIWRPQRDKDTNPYSETGVSFMPVQTKVMLSRGCTTWRYSKAALYAFTLADNLREWASSKESSKYPLWRPTPQNHR